MASINESTSERGVVEVTWDTGNFEGDEITVVAMKPPAEPEKISNKSGPNDGSMTFTYPEGYSGQTVFVVSDDFGNEETFEVTMDDGHVVVVEE